MRNAEGKHFVMMESKEAGARSAVSRGSATIKMYHKGSWQLHKCVRGAKPKIDLFTGARQRVLINMPSPLRDGASAGGGARGETEAPVALQHGTRCQDAAQNCCSGHKHISENDKSSMAGQTFLCARGSLTRPPSPSFTTVMPCMTSSCRCS